MIYTFKDRGPEIKASAFIHPQASVIGSVTIGENVFIGAHAVLRGDIGSIEIKDGSNVQENCTLHMFPGKKVVLEKNTHVGHGAVIHGAHIGENCLIGMNSVVMDEVMIEAECVIGALSFVKAGTHIPRRSMYAGQPAKFIKTVSEDMIDWKLRGTELYQKLAQEYAAHLREITVNPPLKNDDTEPPTNHNNYPLWKEL